MFHRVSLSVLPSFRVSVVYLETMKKNNASAKKYARALFQLVNESKETDRIGSALSGLGILKPLYEKEITDFFSNPFVDENIKIDIIKNVFPKLPETIFNLLFLLIKKNEMRLLPEIAEKYDELVLSSKNTVRAKVISADKLESVSIEKIKKIIEKITEKSVLLENKTDESVIGGLIIKAGDLVIDGSIKGKFGLLSRELLK